ncbi:MAG: DUF2069 domain-containing protein [Halofilum sp. (in: g-proteobacteria)]|nr:DUF2069 domain-containing protein [Halofilum sp. (in: g-proteobacteria)]
MGTATKTCRALALAGYLLLLALLLGRYTWIAPPARAPMAAALLVIVAPLLLPLRGLLRGRAYTHAWTSFLALPYFVLGVDALAAGAGPAWLAWATVTASLGLFAGAVGYARLRGRELRAATGPGP